MDDEELLGQIVGNRELLGGHLVDLGRGGAADLLVRPLARFELLFGVQGKADIGVDEPGLERLRIGQEVPEPRLDVQDQHGAVSVDHLKVHVDLVGRDPAE